MTVSNENGRSGPYTGNGLTTAFDYEFRVIRAEHIDVIATDLSGVDTTLTLGTHYTVTDVGAVEGQVILTSPLPVGHVLNLIRDVPFTQEIDLENQGAYYAETVEQGLDLAAMRDQQLKGAATDALNRAILTPRGEAGYTLLPKGLRGLTVVAFDYNGDLHHLPVSINPSAVLLASIIDASGLGREVMGAANDAAMAEVLATSFAIHNRDINYLNSAVRFGMRSTRSDNDVPLALAMADIASRGGGKLILPASDDPFGIEAPLAAESFVAVEGQGAGATILRIPQTITPGGGLISHPFLADRKTGWSLKNLTIQGNRLAWGGTEPNTQFCGVYLIGCNNFEVSGVEVRDIESDAIVMAKDAGVGGCNHGRIVNNKVFNCKNGILSFKGGVFNEISGNWVDSVQLNGIMVDDATAADTTAATSDPNTGVVVAKNYVSRWSQAGGGYVGIVMTGCLQGSVFGNLLRSGGVVGVDAPSSKAALGIVVNSGENRHNPSIGVTVIGNQIDGVAGGYGIGLIGAWNVAATGNTMRNLFQWPSALSGQAINLLQDTTGASAQKGTTGCVVDGNTVEPSPNTANAVQVSAGCGGNVIGAGNNFLGFSAPILLSGTAGADQVRYSWTGSLPTWSAAWRGARLQSSADDVIYFGTSARFKPASTPTGALPAWTSAQRGDIRHSTSDDKLYVATNSAWAAQT